MLKILYWYPKRHNLERIVVFVEWRDNRSLSKKPSSDKRSRA